MSCVRTYGFVTHDNEARRDPNPDANVSAADRELFCAVDESQRCFDRLLSLVLMGSWIPEIDQCSIAKILRDETTMFFDDLRD
jgi:hypothetical protein